MPGCLLHAQRRSRARRAQGGGSPRAGAPDANAALRDFAAERFRGTRPIAWGDQLTEAWLANGIARGTLATDQLPVRSGAADADR